MTDIQQQINEASARILVLQKEREDCEKSANAHESQARDDRRKMTECKIELAELQTVLRHGQVTKATEDAAAAAKQSQEQATKHLAAAAKAKEVQDAEHASAMEKLTKQQAVVDAMLAKLEAANPTE